jgi:hypothetical protein
MRTKEVETMTIFSLVQPERLASFFEIVATALRTQEEEEVEAEDSSAKETSDKCISPDVDTIDSSTSKGDLSSNESDVTTTTVDGTDRIAGDAIITARLSDYAAITIPCIDFPARTKQRMVASSSLEPVKELEPLFVTVRKSE